MLTRFFQLAERGYSPMNMWPNYTSIAIETLIFLKFDRYGLQVLNTPLIR